MQRVTLLYLLGTTNIFQLGKFEKITFYIEILTRQVELWIFSLVSLIEKTPQNNFSCQNFSVENNYLCLH